MTEWTISRVTDVGAATPCPVRLPEWTARKTTSEIADDPRAMVKVSFLWSVTGRNSIRSIRMALPAVEIENMKHEHLKFRTQNFAPSFGFLSATTKSRTLSLPRSSGTKYQSAISIPAVAFIERPASSRRICSFGAWARLPWYPTPGPWGAGVPIRVKYHVVEEP